MVGSFGSGSRGLGRAMGAPLENQVQEVGGQLQQLGLVFQPSQEYNRRLQDQVNALSGGGPIDPRFDCKLTGKEEDTARR